jgi:hypothetical protein
MPNLLMLEPAVSFLAGEPYRAQTTCRVRVSHHCLCCSVVLQSYDPEEEEEYAKAKSNSQ